MRPTLIIGAVVLVVAAGSWWWLQRDTVESERSVVPFRYGFELRNSSNEAIRDARFEVFGPAQLTGRQEVARLESNLPYSSRRDDLGNHTLEFVVPIVPPYGVKSIVVSGEAILYSPAQASPMTEINMFLGAERTVQTDDPAIQAATKRVLDSVDGNSVHQLAGGIATFVHHHVENVGYLTEDRGAIYALRERQGDCTEYMSLFTALARSGGIPTRRLAGFLVRPGGGVLASSAYHNWAEYYDGRRWTLVDAQRDIVNEAQNTYLTFRVLTERSQLSTTQRFYANDTRLQIKLL